MSLSLRLSGLALAVCLGCLAHPLPVCAESIDQRLYTTIHEDWQSPTLDAFMKGATHIGSGEVGLAICSAMLAFGDEKLSDTGKLALVSIAGAGAVSSCMKYIVNRKRPDSDSDDRFNSSFPSGHATGAFAFASVVGAKYKAMRIPAFALASAVAISRVYLGRHYPSDVLGGAAVGLVSGYLVMRNESTILSIHF
jgi:undecaprenyl-diphosphatase